MNRSVQFGSFKRDSMVSFPRWIRSLRSCWTSVQFNDWFVLGSVVLVGVRACRPRWVVLWPLVVILLMIPYCSVFPRHDASL